MRVGQKLFISQKGAQIFIFWYIPTFIQRSKVILFRAPSPELQTILCAQSVHKTGDSGSLGVDHIVLLFYNDILSQ